MLQKQSVSPRLLETLKDIQKESIFKDYILAGGTALAFQYGHRISTDIDIFTTKKQNNASILNYFQEKYKYYDLDKLEADCIRLRTNGIKIDILRVVNNILEAPIKEEGITFFGKKDIAAMKLRAILTRTVNRDYIDIAYLLREYSLEDMFEFYKKKYNANDAAIVKRALLKCNGIEKSDWNEEVEMLKNDINIMDIPKIINKEIEKNNKKKHIGKFLKNIFKKR